MRLRRPIRGLRRLLAPRPAPGGPAPIRSELKALRSEVEALRLAIGSEAARVARAAATLREAEFRCFSQNGEDGILQWLVARVPIDQPFFVEFGVADYRESNTRFLLQHDNWRGLILDAGSAHLRTVASRDLAWKYALEARSAFITVENVNDVLRDVPDDLGLLSIDIDGNDYWVLAATRLRPRIVVVEYNSVLGRSRPVAVPYDPRFDRAAAHPTGIYSGASIAAFSHWASSSGYRLVGSNAAGNNAFLVREDVAGELAALTPAAAWVQSRFGRPRDAAGRSTHIDSHAERRSLIADMPLVDVSTGERLAVADILD
jgi:hypothetical protein